MQATYYGIPHSIHYIKPESDWICSSHFGGRKCIHHVEIMANEYCHTYMTDWSACPTIMLTALRNQLDAYENRVWQGKDMYAKLGLVRTATQDQIEAAYQTLVLRYNNVTEPQKYLKLQEAYRTLSDPEEKYYYDLPCMKFFGLCGKKKKDGSISITPD